MINHRAYKAKSGAKPARRRFLLYVRALLNLITHLADVVRSCLLAAETERKAECERERHDDTREERLNKWRYAELIERRENREDPDRPASHEADEAIEDESDRWSGSSWR